MAAGSESALSGRWGAFYVSGTRVARCTGWNIDVKLAHTSEWGDSDSKGHTNRAAGRKDRTFSTEGKFDVDSEVYDLFEEGDILEVYLYISKPIAGETANVGAAVPTDLHYHFPRAICLSYKLTVNIDTEEVIGWTAEWGEDGKSYKPGEAE